MALKKRGTRRRRRARAVPRPAAKKSTRKKPRVLRGPRFLSKEQMQAIRRLHAEQRRAAARQAIPPVRPDATRVARRPKRQRARRRTAVAAAITDGLDPRDPITGERLCTDVRNQGNKDERCIAFAVAAAMETALCLQRQTRNGVPEISVTDVFTRGGEQIGAIDTIQDAVRQGVVDSTCFPETATKRCANAAAHTFKANIRALEVPANQRVRAMCAELTNRRPLVAFIEVFANFRNFPGGQPYVAVRPAAGFHAVCIVGFEVDPAGTAGRWIVKNSMGQSWGDGGFFRVAWRDSDVLPEETVFVVEDVQQ